MNTENIVKFTSLYAEVFPETSLDEYERKLKTFFSTNVKDAPVAIQQVLATNTSGTFKSAFVGTTKVRFDITGFSNKTYAGITQVIAEAMKKAGIKTTTVPQILDVYKKLTNKTMNNYPAGLYMNSKYKVASVTGARVKTYQLS